MRRFGIPSTTAREQLSPPQTSREPFRPLPAPTGPAPYRVLSAELEIPAPTDGVLTFHFMADTGGVANPEPQAEVVKAMIADLAVHPEVAFGWHGGDWAYYEGEQQAWIAQVFEAYAEYTRLLIGNFGNHDGASEPSLAMAVRYLCAQKPELLPEVEEFHRDTVTLPNVYWTLRDPLITLIALWTNVPSGGVVEADQEAWLVEELKGAPTGVALGISMHHPPLSVDAHHGGSQGMLELIERACRAAARYPELILCGHVHDTQVFSWELDGHTITQVLSGNGGYRNLHALAPDATPGMEVVPGVTFEYGDASEWGFWRFAVSASQIAGEYIGVGKNGTVTPAKHLLSIPVR